jgi:hypothetical protein
MMAGLGLLVASLATGGCGGAATQDVLESEQAASSSGTSGTSGSGTSGASGSGGTSGTSGTSGAADASVDSSAECPKETEPNNSKETANLLAPTLCGIITPNSESDFLTFQLKASTASMALNFTGQVLLKIDVGGQTVTLGGSGGNGKVPFMKGQRYVIEVKATSRDNSVPWRVDLVEKP